MREEGVPAKSPVDTLYWMRESELKHGRIAQLAGQLGLHPHHLVSTWDYLWVHMIHQTRRSECRRHQYSVSGAEVMRTPSWLGPVFLGRTAVPEISTVQTGVVEPRNSWRSGVQGRLGGQLWMKLPASSCSLRWLANMAPPASIFVPGSLSLLERWCRCSCPAELVYQVVSDLYVLDL